MTKQSVTRSIRDCWQKGFRPEEKTSQWLIKEKEGESKEAFGYDQFSPDYRVFVPLLDHTSPTRKRIIS
ncbi:hypothetical protein DPEC_G00104940 [Dallia pectoralis]|uniref:Uncharacterized protein n=1 Tax=Dallia pectoralis TaxID=75939 RepID=A0ACC2GXJ2_DALPE|nr:hypothetical protein DPEC_G00104940 [Dallia pectoralis]